MQAGELGSGLLWMKNERFGVVCLDSTGGIVRLHSDLARNRAFDGDHVVVRIAEVCECDRYTFPFCM